MPTAASAHPADRAGEGETPGGREHGGESGRGRVPGGKLQTRERRERADGPAAAAGP